MLAENAPTKENFTIATAFGRLYVPNPGAGDPALKCACSMDHKRCCGRCTVASRIPTNKFCAANYKGGIAQLVEQRTLNP